MLLFIAFAVAVRILAKTLDPTAAPILVNLFQKHSRALPIQQGRAGKSSELQLHPEPRSMLDGQLHSSNRMYVLLHPLARPFPLG